MMMTLSAVTRSWLGEGHFPAEETRCVHTLHQEGEVCVHPTTCRRREGSEVIQPDVRFCPVWEMTETICVLISFNMSFTAGGHQIRVRSGRPETAILLCCSTPIRGPDDTRIGRHKQTAGGVCAIPRRFLFSSNNKRIAEGRRW